MCVKRLTSSNAFLQSVPTRPSFQEHLHIRVKASELFVRVLWYREIVTHDLAVTAFLRNLN